MRRLLAVVACGLLATACGGGHASFANQADAICARNPKTTAVEKEMGAAQTPRQAVSALGQAAALIGDMRAKLRRLSPPPGDQHEVSRFLIKIGTLQTDFLKLKRAAQAVDVEKFRKLEPTALRDIKVLAKAARTLGISPCFRP